ncbi:unnamed protein product, partial [Timema podura]|nr:unnamed protein product [Timema podura]
MKVKLIVILALDHAATEVAPLSLSLSRQKWNFPTLVNNVPLMVVNNSTSFHSPVPTHRYHTCKDNSKGRRKEDRMKVLEARRQFAVAKEEADKQVEATLSKARQKSGSVSKTALKVQLMRIKGKAVGPKTIPASERVYFMAHPPASLKRPGKAVFVAKQWHLGRVLDV